MGEGLAAQLLLRTKTKETSPLDMLTGGKYGRRWDERSGTFAGAPKGEGWLGNINNVMNPVTEYSMQYKGREIPTIVPTLTKDEVESVRKAAANNEFVNDQVTYKAGKWADDRARLGLGPFKD